MNSDIGNNGNGSNELYALLLPSRSVSIGLY